MTDDLVARLRKRAFVEKKATSDDLSEAARRIEMLERALKHIAEMNTDTFDAMGPLVSCTWIAKYALEGNYYD